MRQVLDRLDTLWPPHQEPRRRGAQPSHQPSPFLQASRTLVFPIFYRRHMPLDARRGLRASRQQAWARYTWAMDRVRLGRALGYGARHATKTLISAVDAATAPNPSAGTATSQRAAQPNPANTPPQPSPIAQVAEAYRTVAEVKKNARTHARGLGQSVLTPVKRFSSVLWLEVTGTFFALFALVLGQGVWRLRNSFKASPLSPEAHKAYFYLALFLVFAYFSVSSFVRANRRQRR